MKLKEAIWTNEVLLRESTAGSQCGPTNDGSLSNRVEASEVRSGTDIMKESHCGTVTVAYKLKEQRILF